jgi:SAM-dependent methyltransferase
VSEENGLRACAFDEMASTYDETFTDTAVGRALREIVWSRFEPVFHAARQVLELGCGTGEDAVQLVRTGVRVVATDASPEMIQVACRKALSGSCADRIDFRCLAMEQIQSLPGDAVFDGVLSNFGAVNCVGDRQALVEAVAQRMAPGAPLLWVVMGRYAPWEWLWYLTKGERHKAWRRLHRGGTRWRGLTISYPTPRQLSEQLRPHFKVTRLAPLGVVLPPSYAAAWLDRQPRMLRVLSGLEKWAQRASILAYIADHFVIEGTRR